MRLELLDDLRILDADGAHLHRLIAAAVQLLDAVGRKNALDLGRLDPPGDVVRTQSHIGDLAGANQLLELPVADVADRLLHEIRVQQQQEHEGGNEVPEREANPALHHLPEPRRASLAAAPPQETQSTGQPAPRRTFSAVLPKRSSAMPAP